MGKFRTRYDEDYDPSKNYVVMDDGSITEQSGYLDTKELYDSLIRSGRQLRAHRLGVTLEELEHLDEEGSFELRYELDLVEQEEVIERYEERIREIERLQSLQKNSSEDSEKDVSRTVSPDGVSNSSEQVGTAKEVS